LPGQRAALVLLRRVARYNEVIACSPINNRNLACDEGTRLDYCDVISDAGETGMAIIMLGRLYLVLSCWLAPTNATPMQHGRCVAVRPHVT
jgi:hypothetical protein